MRKTFKYFTYTSILIITITTSCKKFIEIDLPQTQLVRESVFSNDITATAAMLGIYNQMAETNFSCGATTSISCLTGWSSDELLQYGTQQTYKDFFENNLTSENTANSNSLWSAMYLTIYKSNAIIESINSSTGLTNVVKKQLVGEAKFLRAFVHFNLINLYGDVPLVINTDYRQNGIIKRTEKNKVLDQVEVDLLAAKDSLSEDYLNGKGEKSLERGRLTKYAAYALLARFYLYRSDWIKAETYSSLVINNTSQLLLLPNLNDVFLKNSKEAIWQLPRANGNTLDASTFVLTTSLRETTLRNELYLAFDNMDKRKTNWISNKTIGGVVYFYASKYKATTTTPIVEYSTVLRLAEQFLIRAEARMRQGVILGLNSAESDINIIRKRAGLENTTSVTPADMLKSIENERRFELFTEWGHRWFDLKRWQSLILPDDLSQTRADDILKALKSGWQKEDKLYPIPKQQLDNDPAMANAQNPGYN